MINPQLQAFLASQQHSHSASSLFPSNLANDPAILYQQQPNNQLQRSISVTNQQNLFDDLQQSFRPISSQSNISSFFGTNLANNQSQQQIKPDDIMTRLAQAMQSHGQQQQEKLEEQRRIEQQRRDLELERFKFEQLRLQHEEEERRLVEQHKLEEELRKKRESSVTISNNNNNNKQAILDQMKEMAKLMEQKKQQQQSQPVSKPQAKQEIDPFLAFQQSVQFQKEQQAKIEAQQYENFLSFSSNIHSFSSLLERKTFVVINNNNKKLNQLLLNKHLNFLNQPIGLDIHHKMLNIINH